MAIIKAEILDALFTSANASFVKGKPVGEADFSKIATIVPSSSDSETYHWLGSFPKLKSWIGERVLNDIKSYGYVIKNETFETSVSIKSDDIADDRLGVYSPLFSEMGREANLYPDRWVFGMLSAGFHNTCYDGQYFFDTDHPVGEKAVSNLDMPDSPTGQEIIWYVLDTSSFLKPIIFQEREKPILKAMDYRLDSHNEMVYGIKARFNVGFGFWQRAFASIKELNAENLKGVIEKMRSLKDDKGSPLGIRPNLLVVPPSLEFKAKELVEAPMVNGSSNILYKSLEVLSSSMLIQEV